MLPRRCVLGSQPRLHAELGIPDGSNLVHIHLPQVPAGPVKWHADAEMKPDPRWRGYELEYLGAQLRKGPELRGGTPQEIEGHGLFIEMEMIPGGPMDLVATVQVWLWAVRYGTSLVYAEARWHPDWGEQYSIRGSHLPGVREKDVVRAWRGMPLLRYLSDYQHSRGRRPVGTGTFRTREECRSSLLSTLVGLSNQGRSLTQERVAAAQHVDDRTLRRWLEAWDPPLMWTELVAEALTLSGR